MGCAQGLMSLVLSVNRLEAEDRSWGWSTSSPSSRWDAATLVASISWSCGERTRCMPWRPWTRRWCWIGTRCTALALRGRSWTSWTTLLCPLSTRHSRYLSLIFDLILSYLVEVVAELDDGVGFLQTVTHVCLITDFCAGGELFLVLERQPLKHFREDSARYGWFTFCVAMMCWFCGL